MDVPPGAVTSEAAAHVVRRVGILAYGSLIGDLGPELQPLALEELNSQTPFRVEFARKSSTRGGGPTLVPTTDGGANVKAKVIVLNDDVTVEAATDMLYRRERHKYDPETHYAQPTGAPGQNDIIIERLVEFESVESVLYTRIAANIPNLTAAVLAQLAIKSVNRPRTAPDGISYLIAAKAAGIATPLSAGYEVEVLRRTGKETLEAALEGLQ